MSLYSSTIAWLQKKKVLPNPPLLTEKMAKPIPKEQAIKPALLVNFKTFGLRFIFFFMFFGPAKKGGSEDRYHKNAYS